ncbi:MAG: pyruvate formate lyase family protein [Candidatus Sumerlaeia bacterium]
MNNALTENCKQTMEGFESRLRDRLNPLRENIFAGNDNHCFIERETILGELERSDICNLSPDARYCRVFEQLLSRISTPVDANDVFVGRMLEGECGLTQEERGKIGGGKQLVSRLIGSVGHGTLDYQELLNKGLDRIVEEADATARRLGTDESRKFSFNAASCVAALKGFALRYADAARAKADTLGDEESVLLRRAAEALEQVPHGPAGNFVEALHAMWIIHFVMSCVVGARDFAYGRMDQYLLPFLEKDLADGSLTEEEARLYLAHFLLKNNEITGLSSAHYRQKPTPSQGTRIYIVLAGSGPGGEDQSNKLSEMILDAACHVKMPEPVLNVRLAPSTPIKFKLKTAELCPRLQGQIAICNDAVIIPGYVSKGVDIEDACTYTLRGCSAVEIGPLETNMTSVYNWLRMPVILYKALQKTKAAAADKEITMDDIFDEFGNMVKAEVDNMVVRCGQLQYTSEGEQAIKSSTHLSSWDFAFESLLIRDCVARGKNASRGGARYMIPTVFCAGIATVGNSLMAIQKIVFDQKRLSLKDFLDIVESDFEGQESFRQEIVNKIPKFGNDEAEVDTITSRAALMVADIIEDAFAAGDMKVIPGFYSLFTHHWIGVNMPATPDGRHAGEPISENQSPVYGTDTKGITALLKSASQLPFDRCFTGSLNIRFGGKTKPEALVALIDTYFKMGGLFLGLTFVNRATLKDARLHPDQYKTLFVRQYGFSEYFIALPVYEQEEFIKRTEI